MQVRLRALGIAGIVASSLAVIVALLGGQSGSSAQSVVPPANRAPTGNDSTDLFFGTGF